MIATIDQIVALLDRDLKRHGFAPLTADQITCLRHPDRTDEAFSMLDDLEARSAISGYARGEAGAFLLEDFES